MGSFFKILSQNLTNWKNFTDDSIFMDGIKEVSEKAKISQKLTTTIATTIKFKNDETTEIISEEDFFNSLPVSNIFPLSRTTDKSVIFYSMVIKKIDKN